METAAPLRSARLTLALVAAIGLHAPGTAHAQQDPDAAADYALSIGLGNAHDLVGLHLEVFLNEHVALFAGTGVLLLPTRSSAAGGVRWFSGPNSGLMLSLQAWGFARFPGDLGFSRLFGVSATVGGRLAWEHLFLTAAIGPQLSYEYVRSEYREEEEGGHLCCITTQDGWHWGGWGSSPLPDIELAFGWLF